MSLPHVPFLRAGALLGAALIAAAPASSSAQEAPPASEYRISVMEALRAHTGAIRTVLEKGAPFESSILAHAAATYQLALITGHAFPEGSGGEATRARDEIWQNAEAFTERVAALKAAAASLQDAATSGDAAATSEALAAVGQTCSGCHRDFREPAS